MTTAPPATALRRFGQAAQKPRPYDLTRDLANGFERNLTPEKITGVVRHNNRLLYMMKWQEAEEDDTDLVMAVDANEKCPQIVIQYLQTLVSFRSAPASAEGETAESDGQSQSEDGSIHGLEGNRQGGQDESNSVIAIAD